MILNFLLRAARPAREIALVLVAAAAVAGVNPSERSSAENPAAEAAQTSAFGNEAGLDAMGIIEQFSNGLRTYGGQFTQQVYDDKGILIEESSGTMALAVPDRLRWRYIEPFEQWVIADGKRVWTWDVDLEQVTVKDQAGAAGDSPLYLLMAPERLTDSYELVDRGEQEGLKIVALMPLEPRADFEWVELGFSGQQLERLVIQDAFGQLTVVRLSGGERNTELDANTFVFKPPEGIDILGADELSLESLAAPD